MNDRQLEHLLMEVQKPGRYSGGEPGSVVKDKSNIDVRFAFCFPDIYEIGMSHLGIKILYSLLNSREDVWCERVFAPWTDMEQIMREHDIPLFALESRDSVADFDIVGFTLQYELSYSNVLNMLDLAGIPLKSRDRKGLAPLIIAGGPCTCNPEPLAEFIDLFVLGEGEEVSLELVDLYKRHKSKGDKQQFLLEASKIPGVYVPSLYEFSYNQDGTINNIEPKMDAPAKIQKRIIKDLNKVHYPERFITPYIEIVHDRAVEEIFRGCVRGCRFCQAGYIYRPVREKSPEVVNEQAKALCESTGYDEISLSSLSTSDYSELEKLLGDLLSWSEEQKISLSLPSLRIDNFSPELMEKIQKIRKSGLTFAPEAGTQRLRDVINKNITEQEIMETCKTAFEGGYTSIKLYFMLGLPTEKLEDIEGIAKLAQQIVDLYYSMPTRQKGKAVNVSVSVSTFVPKPFTPFQFEAQDTLDMIEEKQHHLVKSVTSKKISVSWHDSKTSFLEAVFARGDRRLSKVLEAAWKLGCKFDGWDECFSFENWLKAFDECGVNPEFYANRKREYDEILPWEHLDYGISKQFLIKENQSAYQETTTPNCHIKCSACGAAKYKEGICVEKC